MPLGAGTRLGAFEVLSLLGVGGMGEVYRARDTRLGREVAIKTISPKLSADPDALARFQREAKVIAALSHPGILTIHDVGNEGDVWFLVTEVLEGETLRRRLSRAALPWKEAVRIAIAVAEGLTCAHAGGIVHRDLKPENLFLTGDGRVKILDFGLARFSAGVVGDAGSRAPTLSHPTMPGAIVGTLGYGSPEQVRGETADARSDIFSLGCVLHEMRSGRRPFQRATPAETLAAILKDAPPPSSAGRGGAPDELDRVVLRCLEKDRERRFPSAQDLASALKAVASDRDDRPRAPSVAVLPFVNLSADPENELFADGLTEDVIAHLAKVRALKVISRTSVMQFKKSEQGLPEIAAALGAATLLEGSVRRAGSRVRIVAQLIDAATDQHLWAETYDRELTDIFALQTDVALHIAAALQAELSPDERARIARPPTRDLQAYRLYLEGRHWFFKFTAEGFRQSLEFFQRAIDRDPGFALAHAALAHAYTELGIEGTSTLEPRAAFARAKQAIGQALAFDDGLGEAHGIVGLLCFVCDFDWTGAEREFHLALELSPGSADVHDHYGWMCSALERYDDALKAVRRARELDPVAHRSDVASVLLRAGRCQEALEEAVRLIEVEPGYSRGHSIMGWAQLEMGRDAEGVAALERAVALAPGSTLFLGQLGQAYATTGKTEQARKVLRDLHELGGRQYVPPYHFAYVYAGLGEADTAVEWLERAYEQRAGAIHGVKGSFLFASLRKHPRFEALLTKMNLA